MPTLVKGATDCTPAPVCECATQHCHNNSTDSDSRTSQVCPTFADAGAVGESSMVIEAALGGVAAGLPIALMGVVMVLWSCHKNKYHFFAKQPR